jgi:hypothetical protein
MVRWMSLLATATLACGPNESGDDVTLPACGDGIDNDGDGKVDFPEDPGCYSVLQDDETDDCPSGDGCPECSDGIDNDADGQLDWPDEDQCENASSPAEHVLNPNACGGMPVLEEMPATTTTATLTGASAQSGSCGGNGPEAAYEFQVEQREIVEATTSVNGQQQDTVLYIRRSCGDPATELACNDDYLGNPAATVTVELDPGIYTLLVDGGSTGVTGDIAVRLRRYAPEGEACDLPTDCAPGMVCRDPDGGDATVCTQPRCRDGEDNDDDGLTDFPNDPGCSTEVDDSEGDPCPGAGCPACANGADDDGDGQTDYPNDTACTSASQNSEGCDTESDEPLWVTGRLTTGSNLLASDDFQGTCAFGTGGRDVVAFLDLPMMTVFRANTQQSAFDTALLLTSATCNGELACDTGFPGASIAVNNLAAGTYGVVVDGYNSAESGDFRLNVSGTIAPGGRCDGALATSGAIVCPEDYECGEGGTCIGALACNNGLDDDDDGLADWPNEPGCSAPDDTDETDDCPDGPGCPQCSNGDDDDGDGDIDYPADAGCAFAGATNETCMSSEAVIPMTTPTVNGNTSAAADDFASDCGLDGGAGDVVYELVLPATRTLTLDQNGVFDGVLELRNGTCGTPELSCADGEFLSFPAGLPAGTYYAIVDGWSAGEGTYTLTVNGTLNTGDACDPALHASGMIVCSNGSACAGAPGAEVCVPAACNNAVDDDGAGDGNGYPNDPGCSSISDNDETDDCPAGPNCPECADGVDNDGDGDIDFGNDDGCAAASGASELSGCEQGESDAVVTVSMPTSTGSTTAAVNDFDLTCGFGDASRDVTLLLNLPVPVTTLTMNTNGSNFDTLLAFRASACAADIQCNDDGGVAPASAITRSNVEAGQYGIIIAGYDAADFGNYTLNVSGTVAVGTDCTSPLFTANVLNCPGADVCAAGVCQ